MTEETSMQANNLDWVKRLRKKHLIVGEIKGKSPYGFQNPVAYEKQMEICEDVADVISVHTDEKWGGSFLHLAKMRKMTEKPILAKGFHCTQEDVYAAFDSGADFVLTVGWWNGDRRCWHECGTINELQTSEASRVVWNSRDPRTGKCNPITSPMARLIRGSESWMCQASLIKRREDVTKDANAVLIGESLYQNAQ